MRTLILISLSTFLLTSMAPAQTLKSPQVFASSIEQATTIELFTSHGCSSCPPADNWLRQFVDHPDLWSSIIPIAFHVDYWDYLGWDDEFANADYTRRQRVYSTTPRLKSVYTPGLIVKGEEWRGFFRRTQPDLSAGPQVGKLLLTVDDQQATIDFEPSQNSNPEPLIANVAILGFGIESPIGAGENRGKTLIEDFVVLGHRQTVMQNNYQWTTKLPVTVNANTTRRAVVAWVSSNDPAPIQATGGWLHDEPQATKQVASIE